MAFTENGTFSPAGVPAVKAASLMRASLAYPVSRAFAASASSVAAAAPATSPCCQAVRNRWAVEVTSAAVSGPDFTFSAAAADLVRAPSSSPAPPPYIA